LSPELEVPLNLDLQIRRPGGNLLVEGVLAGERTALSFYPHDWRDPESYRARAERIVAEGRDTEWTEAVHAHGPKARERLEAVRSGSGFVVTTGQQPGLFTGPLYSLYKALTAVRLAERLEALVDRPVAPLFWVASEDHDWAESNHAQLVGVDNEIHRLEVPEREGAGERPLHRIPVADAIPDLLERLEALLPETDVAQEAVGLFREAYGGGEVTLASGFQKAMERLLEPYGVLFVQAHDPVLKSMSRPVLEEAVLRGEELESVLAERSAALEAAGFPVQVPILPDGDNLFVEGPAGRERLYRDGDGYHLRHSEQPLSRVEVLDRIREQPDTVSPNVLLRPVVESHVFPTLSYVAGPGELSYFAQLSPLFDALNVGMPVIHPRFGATVVETKVAKVLRKFDVSQDDLRQPMHELAGQLARDDLPDGVRRALGEIRGALGRGAAELTKAAREVDPTLKGPIHHARSVAMDAIADAEKKILQAVKRENETTLQQLEKARLHLFPDGKPQERVMGPVYYLARYDTEWIDEVLAGMDVSLPPEAESR
jgi:bacillithiol biosynthesis cysteine-adding enzyme BshC